MLRRLLSAALFPAAATVLVLAWPAGLEALAVHPGAALLLRVLRATAWLLPLLVGLAAAHHQRGRLVLAALVLAIAAWAIDAGGALFDPAGEPAGRTQALLVAAAFAVISRLEERGLTSRAGLSRLLTLLTGMGLGGWLIASRPELLSQGLARLEPATLRLGDTPLSPAALALAVLALGFALLSRRRDRREVGPALVFALVSTLAAIVAASGSLPRLAIPLAPATFLCGGSLGLAQALHVLAWRSGHRDPLTGLPSRTALEGRLARLSGRFAMAVLDLDRFKRINDRHGHEAGDAILRATGEALRRFDCGTFHRAGGEEFVAVCPGRGLAELEPALQELLRSISALRVPPPGGGPSARPLRITASVGAAERSRRNPSPERVIAAADAALLRAKRAGRNRLELEKRATTERGRRARKP